MRPAKNFPGDTDCSQGLVIGNYGISHVCQACNGEGCKAKVSRRKVTNARERLHSLSGSTIFTDQKGRAVFVNLETGKAYVQEDL